MYKVKVVFRDKYNPQLFYKTGDPFVSDDKARIKDLTARGLIVEVKEDKQSIPEAKVEGKAADKKKAAD